MVDERIEAAARNSAGWYEAMCRAHGCSTEWIADAWLTRGTPPPYHSNMVTLRGGDSAPAQQQLIRDILAATPNRAFGLKDSFCCIDDDAGDGRRFDTLFTASWIWLDASRFLPRPTCLTWSRIATNAELMEWERAWFGDNPAGAASVGARQFPPALLADPSFAFLAGKTADGRVSAVAAANRKGDVVGLSNVFSGAIPAGDVWPGATQSAMNAFDPGLPLVGYERGDDLAHAVAQGFEVIGELRVLTLAPRS